MKEWRQTITVICTVVLAFSALAALMQFELAAIRAEMSSEHAQMREEMGREHAAIREEMSREHAQMREEMNREHAAIRVQLNSIDRRTARIEGHLFGIEILPDPANELDYQQLEFGGGLASPDAKPTREMLRSDAHAQAEKYEINIAAQYSHRFKAAAIEGIEARSGLSSAILTGRGAKLALCEYSDLASETRTVKHAFHAGIKAILCIDI